MWTLYDELINQIPEKLTVDKFVIGPYRTAVHADGHTGLASLAENFNGQRTSPEDHQGKTLKQMAALVKSWDFTEASLGLAALNSYYNRVGTIIAKSSTPNLQHGPDPNLQQSPGTDAFDFYSQEVAGKKVAAIGHFKGIEDKLHKSASLSIIEREPEEGDYPDSASEYLLPDQDFVFITAMTLQNKTLPRLLQLSKNARVILVGPSLVFSKTLFDYGVETLSGFYVANHEQAYQAVEKGGHKDFYQWGEKIIVTRPPKK